MGLRPIYGLAEIFRTAVGHERHELPQEASSANIGAQQRTAEALRNVGAT
jgi:hypothetical protein